MYAADGISCSVTSNCSAVIAARARLSAENACSCSAHRVCVLWNSYPVRIHMRYSFAKQVNIYDIYGKANSQVFYYR